MAEAREKFILQMVEKLRLDNVGPINLVKLTQHSPTDIRIGREKPAIKEKTPFLAVSVNNSTPLISGGVATSVQHAIVAFSACARDELKAMRIADRLESLLHVVGGANNSYFDFPGDEVGIRYSAFLSRPKATFDQDLDYWEDRILAEVIWSSVPCE